ncbi:MAG: ArsR family transcriptional regulator [Planctomycetes bacterium]|nr:ArsR family transcriptional regulator [Planctomycetota bacterium]
MSRTTPSESLGRACEVRELAPAITRAVRLEICRAIGLEGTIPVSRIVELLDLEQPLISKHLRKLRLARIVVCERPGRRCLCRLSARCRMDRRDGLLRFTLRSPAGHAIRVSGPDVSSTAPEWFESVTRLACAVLCSPSRTKVFLCVAMNPRSCVGSIARLIDQSLALASHHVSRLRHAGLVDIRERRSEHVVSLSAACELSGSPDAIHVRFCCEDESSLAMAVRIGPAHTIGRGEPQAAARSHCESAPQKPTPDVRWFTRDA